TTPGKNHLLGKGRADYAWQELRAANTRENATRHFWHGKHRGFTGHDKVGQHGQFTTAAHRKAFDRRDDGQRAAQEAKRRLLENDMLLPPRSEEHTSELQSRGHLVCR